MDKEKRTAKVLNEKGEIIEVSLEELVKSPIRHNSLSDDLLERIRNIFEVFREHLCIASLEQFEIDFMRDENPETEIALWENMVLAYKKAITVFGDNAVSKNLIFHTIVAGSIQALTKEELEDETIQDILKIFYSIAKENS